MQYNVENLFDTVHDEGKNDEDFTPEGKHHWTPEALQQKLDHLAEVVQSIKNPDGTSCPDILTLCEIENTRVLQMWTHGALASCQYKHIITDDRDPDIRGIQVAILTKLDLAAQPISHPVYKGGRFIEEASFKVGENILTVFADHWKSRLIQPGQPHDDESKREQSATIVRKRVEQILQANPDADIVVAGDLNDEFEDTSIQTTLGTSLNPQDLSNDSGKLFWEPSSELLSRPEFENVDSDQKDKLFKYERGTYYYSHDHSFLQFDHILLSKGLFDDQGFSYQPKSFQVVRLSKYTTPRTHAPLPYAFKENDSGEGIVSRGASDHFPVMLRLNVNEQ